MESNWVKPFYKRQFELYSPSHKISEYDTSLSAEIIEQVGKTFQSVLELGAGNGRFARALATPAVLKSGKNKTNRPNKDKFVGAIFTLSFGYQSVP
ncbi:hypothetical protein KD050_11185 [Psychrobacillus sp. INOP01]|uniref:hypothetical protein n=1 Tax=Psychrobacillus sp. INOP01 TaxID=2829187 RepID=UPI001BAACDA6|nr:hypothetical protein [Psychrobacillus sp. INOP01]QUG39907.1 hypothetical protein KD050_11185 [Psychrobacillus sp. INOP01]